VVAAGRESGAESRDALATLCRLYWYPLYVFVRRRGFSPDQAADHTQAFFTRLLEQRIVRGANREKGRFRSYLLGALKHHLLHEWAHAQAQTRGGGRDSLSLDFSEAEDRYCTEPAHDLTPEKIFDRQWAVTVLELAMAELERQTAAAGKHRQFMRLRAFLGGGSLEAYQRAAVDLGLTEGAVSVLVHRFRRRYRDLVREQIAHTVQSPEEVDDEVRHLFAAVGA
jgi:RNA polymerase sigma-70 factor (ECF subfamily)